MDELIEMIAAIPDLTSHVAVMSDGYPSGIIHGPYEIARRVVDALKAAGYEVVKLPEPESVQGDVSNWWGGDIWCTPGSGRLRVYVQDARFRVGEALSFAANVVAAARAAEETANA